MPPQKKICDSSPLKRTMAPLGANLTKMEYECTGIADVFIYDSTTEFAPQKYRNHNIDSGGLGRPRP